MSTWSGRRLNAPMAARIALWEARRILIASISIESTIPTAHAIALFRERDEETLIEAQAIYRDEAKLIQSAQEATEELTALFEADREST